MSKPEQPKAERKLKAMPYKKLIKTAQKFYDNEQWEEAAPYFMEVWHRHPDDKEILIVLAFLLSKLGVRAHAIALLEKALEVHGPTKDILAILGDMASKMEMHDIALQIYRISTNEFPDDPMGYVNLASALGSLDKHAESISVLQQVIPHFPTNALMWNVLASHVSVEHGPAAAVEFYEEALRLDPDHYMALNNLANVYLAFNDHQKAIETAERAHKAKPDHYEPLLLLGTLNMTVGNIVEGFEQYEARYDPRRPGTLLFHDLPPTWQGEDLAGKNILVANEQGLGDEVLFAVNLPSIMKQAKKVFIGCDNRLVKLLERSFPGAKAVTSFTADQEGYKIRVFPEISQGIQNGDFTVDYSIKAGSAPRYLWQDVKDIPNYPNGFLTPDPNRVDYWKDQLDQVSDKPKVGIIWRSGMRNKYRDLAYTQIEDWAEIFENQGVTFVCLQYDDCSEEIAEAKEKYGVDIYLPKDLDQKNNIDDTCALIKALDLVIGVSTAPAHMANAVGTPVWWVLKALPWWYFGETENSAICGNSRTFNGQNDPDWTPVMQSIAKQLKKEFPK